VSCKITVVIPTRNRAALLRGCLTSLERQTLPPEDYEVVVVVDGSTDGTLEMVRDLSPCYRLRHVWQDHGGLSAARNRGNREAQGALVLCLDDDMLAAPELLAAHLRTHEDHPGGLVQGALAIDRSVRRTPFIRYQERLLDQIHAGRTGQAAILHSEDVSGGNISIAASLLESVGGFNERLKRLRNTDGELAHRLQQRGSTIRYAGQALARMTHFHDLAGALDASYLYGRSYVYLQQEHPETRWKLSPLARDRGSLLRHLARRLFLRGGLRLRAPLALARLSIGLCEAARLRPPAEALYRLALDGHFWRGVEAESEGRLEDYVPQGIPILCYHQVSDLRNDAFRLYILPVARFRRQMLWLKEHAYQAISLDALHGYLDRAAPLPPKPVVITFDDAYAELETTATPLLAELGYPHTHFVNSGKIGGTTDWIKAAPDLAILAPEAIRRMAERHGGLVAFEAHGRGHLQLNRHDAATVRDEVRHCIEALEPLSGQPVRYMAYPFGDESRETRDVMRELPIRCSFTVDQGLCRPGQDLHGLPRVEIFSHDLPIDFRFKVRFGFSPIASARRRLKRIYKKLRGRR